ncbi:MAG: metal-dependent hydrolase [Thermoguttaceae bacterium]|jgi:hypothetical protein
MANFQTHLTGSTILGIGYAAGAYALYGVPPSTCVLAGGLCSLSGMLPDIDSGPGRPLREITAFLAAVVPCMLSSHLHRFGISAESVVLTGAAVYASIRFGLAYFLRHHTVHRGMFHSLPTAAIFGELTYLLAYGENPVFRWFIAGGTVLGFLSHLVLDEVYSVQWDGSPRLKKSFGTALKIFGNGWGPNVAAFSKLAVLSFLVVYEPGVLRQVGNGHVDRVVRRLATEGTAQLTGTPQPTSVSTPRAAEPSRSSPSTARADNSTGRRRWQTNY